MKTDDPKQVKEARRRQRNEAQHATEELRQLLEIPEFRRFLIRLLLETHHRTVYTGFGASAGVMASFLAVENLGKKVLDWVLQADPRAYTLLMVDAGAKAAADPKQEERDDDTAE